MPTHSMKACLFIPRSWPTKKWFDSIPYSMGAGELIDTLEQLYNRDKFTEEESSS